MLITHRDNELSYGYNAITEEDGKHSNMLMDFGVYKMRAGEKFEILEGEKEAALILFNGRVRISWNGESREVERGNCFDDGPYVLHVSKETKVDVEFLKESELGVQKTTNEKVFEAKFYTPEECKDNIFGDGLMNGTARRMVRDVFNYHNAPYSNMVMGEVITYPGRWSSYPPHSHEQPEIYFYKFTKPQGFGCSIIGNDIYKIKENSTAVIPGDLVHPQVAAPGYGMYYCWMIRHLEGNPWTERVDDPDHVWLHERDAVIWPEK